MHVYMLYEYLGMYIVDMSVCAYMYVYMYMYVYIYMSHRGVLRTIKSLVCLLGTSSSVNELSTQLY